MKRLFMTLRNGLKPAFRQERVICRIITAWCVIAAAALMTESSETAPFTSLSSFGTDISLSVLLLGIVLNFILLSVVATLLPAHHTDSWVLMLGATACVARWMIDYSSDSTNKNGVLFLLAVLVAYTFFVTYFLKVNSLLLGKWQPGERTVTIFAAVCGLLGGGVIAAITCLRYATFSSPNFDFGLFCQMFHYMKVKGIPLITCERNVLLPHFVVHLSPIFYLMLPFYALFPSPMTLQIAQAVLVASGVIPVFLLCRNAKMGGKATMLVCLIYSFFPALAGSCFYDLHENCFLTPILLWLFWSFETKKTVPLYICAVLLLMVKEDAAVYLLVFALYLLLSRRSCRHGAVLAGMAVVWFGAAMLILSRTSSYWSAYYAELGVSANPSIAGPMISRYNNLVADTDGNLPDALRSLLVNPGYLLTQLFTTSKNGWEKFVYFLQMILPLGFLPFCTRKPSRWLLLTPWLMNLLTMYQYQYNIGFQYHYGISAFLIYAMILNLPELRTPTRRSLLSFGAAACCCIYLMSAFPKLGSGITSWNNGKETYRRMDEILDTLPDDASLCVSTMLLAHVHDHDILYEIGYNIKTVKEDGTEKKVLIHDDVDYVVLDQRYNTTDYLNVCLENGYEKDPDYAQYENLILVLRRAAE